MKVQTTVTKKEQATLKLVEGTYTPSEAADILFSLIGDKIKFHNLQMLSLQERFGIESVHSEQRIKELKAAKMEAKDLILQARDAGYTLQIEGDIKISFLSEDQ
ncbi:hypothetical protein [Muriicola soli]|uniref:Uncharacterized protein n=1 Tax=Muriicola soli TaxID=2507538 RepID=A0A411EBL8_9FLAO|nr:hypothetical protein [Muriicola soli]QBA65125.1 hypothetical protein EQY75_11660 [Muriicola soli]